MDWKRGFPAFLLVTGLLFAGCSKDDDDPPPPPPPEPVHAVGWIGGGLDGWQTGTAPPAGTDYQSFDRPYDVCVDASGNIYAADRMNHRVCKWNGAGTALGWIGGGQNGWQTGNGSSAASDFQSFSAPVRIAVDANGFIYVCDRGNHRISKWDGAGSALGWIGGASNGWQTTNGATAGSDHQSFDAPWGVWVDGSGNIYVADFNNSRLCKWDGLGNAVGWFGGGLDGWRTTSGTSSGSDYRSFNSPMGVCVDGAGNIYVADAGGNARICKWDGTGTAVGWIGGGLDGWQTGFGASWGSSYKHFFGGTGVFVDGAGNIYVPENINCRVSKWDATGNAVGWIGGGQTGWQTGNAPSSAQGYQSFSDAVGVFLDGNGNIYVADPNNNRVCWWQE